MLAFNILSVVLFTFCSAEQFCCDSQSKCVKANTLNTTMKQFVKGSPYYETVLSINEQSKGTISTCHTFFPVTEAIYISFRRTIYDLDSKRETQTQLYIISDVPGAPGHLRIEGLFRLLGNETTVTNTYILDVACEDCESPVYAVYTCFILDTCRYVRPELDFLYGLSSLPNSSAQCQREVESIFGRYNFKASGFFRPPGTNFECVTCYNGGKCVNADSVSAPNSVSFPQ